LIVQLTHTFSENIKFEDINNYFHSIFSNIFYKYNQKNTHKKSYTFKISRYKVYVKNKKYNIYFNTSDNEIMQTLLNNLDKFKFKLLKEHNPSIQNIIKISNLNFEIYDIVLKNWNIESDLIGKKKRIDYRKEFSLDLLKELIEVQTYLNLDGNLKNLIVTNGVSKNGIKYYKFIDNIILGAERKVKVKDGFVFSYDVILNIKNEKKSLLLANNIIHSGAGAKNSFGLGYAEFYKL